MPFGQRRFDRVYIQYGENSDGQYVARFLPLTMPAMAEVVTEADLREQLRCPEYGTNVSEELRALRALEQFRKAQEGK